MNERRLPSVRGRLLLGLTLLSWLFAPGLAWADPSARFEPKQPVGGSFEVVGLSSEDLEILLTASPTPEAWHAFFTVHSLDGDGEIAPRAMLGRHRVSMAGLGFEPRFPPVPGLSYRVRLDLASLLAKGSAESVGHEAVIEMIVTVPQVDAPPVILEQVYPTAAQVPANLLKLYFRFSGPMARGEVARRVTLLDESGAEVAYPFLEIDEELWDPEQRRLTLFFDPGRIKRGLRPHAESGPPLTHDQRYRLVVDGAWPDAYGRPIDAGFEKVLQVVADDRNPPRLADWQVSVPRAGSRDPLTVTFGEAMDHALALRMIRVEDEAAVVLHGDKILDQHEGRWQFVPASPWRVGDYRLSIDGALEDLAGNSLRGAFDRDVTRGEEEADVARFELPFVVDR